MSEKEEEKRIDREVKAGLSILKMNNDIFGDNSIDHFNGFTEKDFGVCASCIYFFGIETRYEKLKAVCNFTRDGFRLNSSDPIKRCSNYEKRGLMSLNDMRDIAILIEAGNEKKIGLIK